MGVFFALLIVAVVMVMVFLIILVCLALCLIAIGLSGLLMNKIYLKHSISFYKPVKPVNIWGSLALGVALIAAVIVVFVLL
jgi:hypothetical protein